MNSLASKRVPATWTLVEEFPQVDGASLAGIDSATTCADLLTVGRQIEVGKILNFSARMVPSPFFDLGFGTVGTQGVPHLDLDGTLQPSSPVVLELTSARRNAAAALVLGSAAANLPVFGGTLVPAPQVVFAPLVTDAAGSLVLWSTWPSSAPGGFSLFLQALIADPQATGGVALSNAVLGAAP